MLETLQSRGMMKRAADPDPSLIRELFTSISSSLDCTGCHKTGVEVLDDWTDDWDDEVRCEGCNTAIDPERLEVFPDTKFCPACQGQAESGGTPGAEAEFCASCGGLMKLAKRGGVGLAGYQMVCGDCGKRG